MWPNNLQVSQGRYSWKVEWQKPYTDFSADPEAYKVAFQTMITLAREMGHRN